VVPQPLQALPGFPPKLNGIERLVKGAESLLGRCGDLRRFEDPLIRGLGLIVTLDHFRPEPLLGDEPHGGLEEVHPEAQHVVDGAERGGGRLALVPLVADEAADDRPIAFFDVGLVILAILPAAGEGEALGLAVGDEVGVDERAVVVGVDAPQREGQPLADRGERGEDAPLAAVDDGPGFKPGRGDVDDGQALDVLPVGRLAAVTDEVQFRKAGVPLIPLGKGADGDVLLEQAPRARRGQAAGLGVPPIGGELCDRWWRRSSARGRS